MRTNISIKISPDDDYYNRAGCVKPHGRPADQMDLENTLSIEVYDNLKWKPCFTDVKQLFALCIFAVLYCGQGTLSIEGYPDVMQKIVAAHKHIDFHFK